MDELRALRAEEDHTCLMNRMRNIDISGIFEEYNTRVLIASFMLYKFREEYNIDDELFELSKVIADAMVELDFMTISKNYKKYFNKFLQWRNGDIEQMRQDLRNQVEACRTTMTPPRDIADRTWNECMENSIQLMNKTEEKLEKMSKTPPKC
jgi:hypothetical protein